MEQGADAVRALEEALKYRWSLYANRDPIRRGRLFYFVVSADLNDQVVLFMYGEDRQDARVRLEASLRVLGAGHLLELGSDEPHMRLNMPLCPRDNTILIPGEPWLFGLAMTWFCRHRACHYRRWTFGIGARPSVPQNLLEAGTPLDINVR